MEVRELGRVAIDRWISVARLPLDVAVRLLPGDPGRRSTARLALDGTEATLRRAVGALLNDDAMCAEAERRRVAVDKRRRAIELHEAADDKRRVADSQLSEELQRASELREQAARDAEDKIRKTEADRERRKARVLKTCVEMSGSAIIEGDRTLGAAKGLRAWVAKDWYEVRFFRLTGGSRRTRGSSDRR